jgi:hypothetical protein
LPRRGQTAHRRSGRSRQNASGDYQPARIRFRRSLPGRRSAAGKTRRSRSRFCGISSSQDASARFSAAVRRASVQPKGSTPFVSGTATSSRRTPPCERDCDRSVIRQVQNIDEHRGLRTHTELSLWKVKSLTACALTCSGVSQCWSPASLSKRAPSTTRTSLRLEINDLRAVRQTLSHSPSTSEPVLRSRLHLSGLTPTRTAVRRNCVRPPNVPRSLTSILLTLPLSRPSARTRLRR